MGFLSRRWRAQWVSGAVCRRFESRQARYLVVRLFYPLNRSSMERFLLKSASRDPVRLLSVLKLFWSELASHFWFILWIISLVLLEISSSLIFDEEFSRKVTVNCVTLSEAH